MEESHRQQLMDDLRASIERTESLLRSLPGTLKDWEAAYEMANAHARSINGSIEEFAGWIVYNAKGGCHEIYSRHNTPGTVRVYRLRGVNVARVEPKGDHQSGFLPLPPQRGMTPPRGGINRLPVPTPEEVARDHARDYAHAFAVKEAEKIKGTVRKTANSFDVYDSEGRIKREYLWDKPNALEPDAHQPLDQSQEKG